MKSKTLLIALFACLLVSVSVAQAFYVSDKTNIDATDLATDDEFLVETSTGTYNALTIGELEEWLYKRTIVSVKSYGATGAADQDDTTALSLANAAGYDLYFPEGTYTVASDLTLSENLIFANGAKLYATNGATITISKEVIAGNKQHIFDFDTTPSYFSLTWMREASVHWFGATGAGTVTDTAKVQKCVDSLAAGTVRFFAGTYKLDTAVTISTNSIGFRGLGQSKSVITKGGLDTDCFTFAPSDIATGKLYNSSVTDLTFQTVYEAAHTSGSFISMTACDRFYLSNLLLIYPYRGITLSSCQNGRICDIDSLTGSAAEQNFQGNAHIILTEDASTPALKKENANIFISNFSGRGTTGSYLMDYGMAIQSSDGIFMDNSYFGTCKYADLLISPVNDGDPLDGTQLTGVVITNSWFDPVDTTGVGIKILGATDDKFGMIQISNCIVSGGTTGATGISVQPTAGTSFESLSISGCLITNFTGNGIVMVGTISHVNITGNRITHVGTTSGSGIVMDDVTDFVISGNDIGYKFFTAGEGDSLYGISILSGCARYSITGNNIMGNATAAISDAGDATKVIEGNLTPDTDGVTEVASATTTTLPVTGHVFAITGTTNITSVTASRVGRVVTLKFEGILTFTDGSNLKLAGNFTTSGDDTITLACDGTNWYEIARSAN